MRSSLKIALAALAIVEGVALAADAQMASAPASAPPISPAPSTATRAIMRAQLNAPKPAPSAMGGDEAKAIYDHYVAGLGRPIQSTMGTSSGGQGSFSHGAGYQ